MTKIHQLTVFLRGVQPVIRLCVFITMLPLVPLSLYFGDWSLALYYIIITYATWPDPKRDY